MYVFKCKKFIYVSFLQIPNKMYQIGPTNMLNVSSIPYFLSNIMHHTALDTCVQLKQVSCQFRKMFDLNKIVVNKNQKDMLKFEIYITQVRKLH